MTRRGALLLALLLLACSDDQEAPPSPAPRPTTRAELRVVSTEEAPYQHTVDGEITGVSADVLGAILAEAGYPETTITMRPWARAYKQALARPNTLIFTITRTPEREDLFHWTCPLFAARNVVYKLRQRDDIRIATLDDVRRYRLSLWRDDVRHQYFQARGFDNFELVPDDKLNVSKLLAGRTDLYVGNPLTLRYQMERVWGFSADAFAQLEPVLTLEGTEAMLYIALNRESDPALRDGLAAAGERVRASPRFAAILQRYDIDPAAARATPTEPTSSGSDE